MAAQVNDYETLRSLPYGEIDRRLRDDYPAGNSAQWWNSILESAESEVIARIHKRERIGRDVFDFALHMLRSGSRDSVDAGYAGRWYLRIAALARRAGMNASDLPHDFTPDGAARIAISLIPLTREQAVASARRRDVALFGDATAEVSDAELQALQDCELIIPSLDWIRESITDQSIRGEVSEWFRVYDLMAPNAR